MKSEPTPLYSPLHFAVAKEISARRRSVKKHPNFKQFQGEIPLDIRPVLRRVCGGNTVDRVPGFVHLVMRDGFSNFFTVTVKKQIVDVECVHVMGSSDPDCLYGDMRGYAIGGVLFFVFSKGAGNKNENHKVAERYLVSILTG